MVLQSMKNSPNNNLEAAYVALSDKNSSDPVIYNINVFNEEQNYKDIPVKGHNYFEEKYLEQYKKNLKNIGAKTKYINFQGVRALEYQYEQMGIPYKAIVFLKGKKSILLQMGGSLRILNSEFELLKSNFKLNL